MIGGRGWRGVQVVPDALLTATRFKVIVSLYAIGIVVFTLLAIRTGMPSDLWPVAALAALFGLAEHRDRVFADETGLSGSIAVALAASFYVVSQGWLTGAFVCCAVGGLYVPHLRHGAFAKVIVNSASFGVSALACASLLSLFSRSSVPTVVLSLVVATATYWAVNSALLALATSALNGNRTGDDFAQLIRSDTVMLVFGLGGAACGVVMSEVGTWTGMATLVALLIALDVFVISVPSGLTVLRSAWAVVLARGVAGGVAGTVGAFVTRALSFSLLGAAAGLVVGTVAGVAVVLAIVGARLLVLHRRVDTAVVRGLVVVELAFPVIGAISGVTTAIGGLSTGLVVASALVAAGSLGAAARRRRSERALVAPDVDDEILVAAVVEAMLDGLPSQTRDP